MSEIQNGHDAKHSPTLLSVGPSMTQRDFNENPYLGIRCVEIWKNREWKMKLSNFTHLMPQMNFEFRKYEQKWMPRWLELKCFCDFQVCLTCAEFSNPVAGCIPEWNLEVQEQIFPAAPLGPRGRGPSLRAFLLLAALQIARFLCCMIASLMVCCAIHIILPRCYKRWLQCEDLCTSGL